MNGGRKGVGLPGIFAMLAAIGGTLASGCSDAADAAPAPQNLILISVDTLRADRLGAYGYDRPTSPALDALAAAGVRVETVIAESSWTLPAHVTMLSGLPPAIHGANLPSLKPSSEVPMLAETLRGAGFRTFGFTGGVFLTRRYGFDRGFEAWDERGLRLGPMLRLTLERIRAVDPAERFFAFVHTYDVHCPYDPPAGYAERFATRPASDAIETAGRCGNPHFNSMELTPGQGRFLSDRYDAGIRAADDVLRRFFEALKEEGRLEDTLVVVVSDHGDEFLEHGRIGHRGSMYIQSLRVPWIMAGGGLAPAVVSQPAGLVDVVPTLLDLLRVPAPEHRGISLVPHLRGTGERDPDRGLYSESEWGPVVYGLVTGRRHIVVEGTRLAAHVFDWHADPEEQNDRFERGHPATQALWREVQGARERQRADPARRAAVPLEQISPEQKRALEALGYVDP